MFNQAENMIHYKWDPATYTGFTLRYDAEIAASGDPCCLHVEDWTCRTVINEWPCQNIEEVLQVLNRFFTIDLKQEHERLCRWLNNFQCIQPA